MISFVHEMNYQEYMLADRLRDTLHASVPHNVSRHMRPFAAAKLICVAFGREGGDEADIFFLLILSNLCCTSKVSQTCHMTMVGRKKTLTVPE